MRELVIFTHRRSGAEREREGGGGGGGGGGERKRGRGEREREDGGTLLPCYYMDM